jgi:hypothetical protein
MKGVLYKLFGFGPGNENGRIDLKWTAEKKYLPDQVGNGFLPGGSFYQQPEFLFLGRGKLLFPVGDEISVAGFKNVFQQ